MIKGFLFDMDGTVFDTERVYKESWHEVSKELGYDIPDQLLDMMRGSSRQSAIKIFNDFYGDDPHDYAEARQLREVVADRRLREGGVPLKPGARELTTYLRDKGISLALATSTYRPVVDFYLSDSGMEDVFEKIASLQVAVDGDQYNLPALRVKKNLAAIGNYDNDRISFSGTIESGGNQIVVV